MTSFHKHVFFQNIIYFQMSDFSSLWSHLSFSFTELITEFESAQVDSSSQQCLRSLSANLKQAKEEANVLFREAQRITVEKGRLSTEKKLFKLAIIVNDIYSIPTY